MTCIRQYFCIGHFYSLVYVYNGHGNVAKVTKANGVYIFNVVNFWLVACRYRIGEKCNWKIGKWF